jgi:hypothetical protein
LDIPGLTPQQNTALVEEFAVEASRTLQHQQRHARLSELSLPLVQIERDPAGIDEGAIFAIADQLTDQLTLEAV